jgi:hypothetical protein
VSALNCHVHARQKDRESGAPLPCATCERGVRMVILFGSEERVYMKVVIPGVFGWRPFHAWMFAGDLCPPVI